MSITEANTETERKTISPEDLPSSDNLGVTVSFPLTNSTNYDEWAAKFLIKVLTLTIKKLGSTDTSITEPAARSSTFEVWNGRYSAVRNWLRLLQMSFEESASIWKDRISLLPDSLLCHILSFLTTKEAVCTSVLSSRWRDLWKWVPSLDLVSLDFPSDKVCVDFINEFLLNFKSLNEFTLCLAQEDSEEDDSIYELCMDKVTKCKIQHFQVNCYRDMEISLTLPVCEALVSLKLYSVKLNDFESLSLPCLKVMFLEHVIFPHSAVLDTPRLENLTLTGYQSISFMIIKRMSDHVKVDIDVDFQLTTYDLSEGNIIYNFLNNFSAVKDITLSLMNTFELFYCLHFMNPLPKFRELTRLRATMWLEYSLELLPLVLETCPNLRHLTLNLVKNDDLELLANCLSEVLSFCLVSSLEYVDIESPITEKATEEEVVRYFLGNATSLKKLVLRLNVSDGERHNLEVLKQCFDSPRRSSLCQFDVLLVVQTQDKMKEL